MIYHAGYNLISVPPSRCRRVGETQLPGPIILPCDGLPSPSDILPPQKNQTVLPTKPGHNANFNQFEL